MHPGIVFGVITVYFALLVVISNITSRKANLESFFNGNRQSPWYVVAFGMIGASLSGITFVSVPGIVGNSNFYYFQMVLGYMLGYLVIGTVLLPLYYRLNLVSIYTYLGNRFGPLSHKTGAALFLISQSIGASLRLFVVAGVLQIAFFNHFGIPFATTVLISILLIWVYTHKAGIKTIVWTDTLQTFFMILSVIISIIIIANKLNFSFTDTWQAVVNHPYSKVFNWDWSYEKNFYKQFVAGALIAIVMTGLDQNMMQKNLTCKNLKDAQKNVFWFSISILFTNLIFLTLGVLLYIYAEVISLNLTIENGHFINTDNLYTNIALNHLGVFAGITFLLGIIAAAFSSADSALTSLTTSYCTDFMNLEAKAEEEKKRAKNRTHIIFSLILFLIIMLFKAINNDSVINAVFTMASYTYGPLLGLFVFGITTKRKVFDKWVPLISILAPVLSYFLNYYFEHFYNFKFGFSILLINGVLTLLGLKLVQKKHSVS